MTSVLTTEERDLDDQLLWLLLGQPPSITIQLLATSTGAVLYDQARHRVAEVSVSRLPRDVDPLDHWAAMADADESLNLDGEWVADNPRGCSLGAGFDRLRLVEFRPAGDPR